MSDNDIIEYRDFICELAVVITEVVQYEPLYSQDAIFVLETAIHEQKDFKAGVFRAFKTDWESFRYFNLKTFLRKENYVARTIA